MVLRPLAPDLRVHACSQAAQERIGALVAGAAAAIHKDARAAEAALAEGAKVHADALQKHEEALRQLHAAYEAAVAAEWGRVQATGKRQAAFIKVASCQVQDACGDVTCKRHGCLRWHAMMPPAPWLTFSCHDVMYT